MASEVSLFGPENPPEGRPLADRLRPASLEEVVGQDHLLAPGSAFRAALEKGALGSVILWGPPGSGKTTIALLISHYTGEHFVSFSAVTGGVADVRRVVEEARAVRSAQGRSTLLFVDEIHRFNRAQQDAFLPHVEDGTIRLVGATTENPSFELNAPLLSRCTVYVLERLSRQDIGRILDRAIESPDGLCSADPPELEEEALELLAELADGDGRRALNMLDSVCRSFEGRSLSRQELGRMLRSAPLLYDGDREEHYNLISALHKSLRSGDPDAALYWLARMMSSGEDPLYIARRLIRFATEDVGLADPSALTVAMRAADSYGFLGSPEGDLALAEAVVYLAMSPRSNSLYVAWKRALEACARSGSLPVPLHLRNAP
ncbi:replication-associated recombination protein A, partial [Candidatus Fermentibacterales bacterium]|nr:replication-associated recombination protein A [Candidatus Fermentibacterales bacterium]